MEDLIVYGRVLFDDKAVAEIVIPQPQSPLSAEHTKPTITVVEAPLPPTPTEPAPQYAYGSRNTKVVNVESLPSDFSPALPAWPTNSIHPGGRGQPSPTKENFAPPPLPKRPTVNVEQFPPSPAVTSTTLESEILSDTPTSTESETSTTEQPSATEGPKTLEKDTLP